MKIKLTAGVIVEKQKRKSGEEIEVAGRVGRQLIGAGKAVEVLSLKVEKPVEEKPKAAPKKKRIRKKPTLEEIDHGS